MSIHVHLTHSTAYAYDRLVSMAPQIVRLRPAPHCRTRILSYGIQVQPKDHFLNWQQDAYANFLGRVMVPERTKHFQVDVSLVADMAVINPFDFFLEPEAERWPFTYTPRLKAQLAPYLRAEPAGPLVTKWMEAIPKQAEHTVPFLFEINARLQKDIDYLIRMEPGVQTPEETLEKARGSCRDSGWLLVNILRHMGLAARFCSGYLIQLKADQKALDGPSGTEVDFTDLHAWCEVYLPGAGWVGLDPTSGLFAGEGHIPLAATPEPLDAAPITGAVDECEVEFSFEMDVKRIHEIPRVTKPYTDSQWAGILKLGDEIDRRLTKQDVRLTVGGEPTFVSADDRQGMEWMNDAVGPAKRGLSDVLIRRLRQRFAPSGMLHYGQGKWYPGESLPRWAFSLFWRKDQEPVWDNPDLIAAENAPVNPDTDTARRFTEKVSLGLGIDPAHVQPAYEAAYHYLNREMFLPPNDDPLDSRVEDPEERARLARVFARGLDTPAAFILPVQRWQGRAGPRWVSEMWQTRAGRLYLMPGDSPSGLRLPLQALPWVPAVSYPIIGFPDPFIDTRPLPPREQLFRRVQEATSEQPYRFDDPLTPGAGRTVRTAMTVEVRDGHMCVFMPPVNFLEDYLEVLAVVEAAARDMGLPVHLEGYSPPNTGQLQLLKVTPDPGVIEVNIQPTHSWREQVNVTQVLYDEAYQARLSAEKFMIDGKHSGTGGGNHIVVGGATPPDSPFLRRPDLLRSLISYWQAHPSLSYLFSGMFIGPTSQSPRLDEARMDSLYELEIANRQVPDPFAASGAECPPWMVDRIYRNLLTDVTGNTHRAEICIDKLYSPDSPTGRLGLVEFRAFEMPPHSQMALAQALLLRGLISEFWSRPFVQEPVRWGTALHDKFMLPHFVWQDFTQVLNDLAAAGIPVDPRWFHPHQEFRFPLIGDVRHGDLTLELRSALEPWPVLGEEGMAGGGTARYVDSSVERLQIKLTGDLSRLDQQIGVAVNGITVPLIRVAEDCALVGLRYRAWQPASSLHPSLPPDAPLGISVVDLEQGVALTGCRYGVAHPGGRSYETFPVNAFEAESRRLSRFERGWVPPGTLSLIPGRLSAEFPHTMDMRRHRVGLI